MKEGMRVSAPSPGVSSSPLASLPVAKVEFLVQCSVEVKGVDSDSISVLAAALTEA